MSVRSFKLENFMFYVNTLNSYNKGEQTTIWKGKI